MGLFGLFGKKQEPDKPEEKKGEPPAITPEVRRQALLEIAKIISLDDPALMAQAAECVGHPDAYLTTHKDQYADWDFAPGAWADPKRIQWIGLVMMLEEKSHVCCRDWKDERPDFVYFLQELTGTKRLGLELREDWLDEEGDVGQWLEFLNEKWEPEECCVGVMDTNSDSYTMFVCRTAEWRRLVELAAQAGEVIE